MSKPWFSKDYHYNVSVFDISTDHEIMNVTYTGDEMDFESYEGSEFKRVAEVAGDAIVDNLLEPKGEWCTDNQALNLNIVIFVYDKNGNPLSGQFDGYENEFEEIIGAKIMADLSETRDELKKEA